jgi:hypothetical protein
VDTGDNAVVGFHLAVFAEYNLLLFVPRPAAPALTQKTNEFILLGLYQLTDRFVLTFGVIEIK